MDPWGVPKKPILLNKVNAPETFQEQFTKVYILKIFLYSSFVNVYVRQMLKFCEFSLPRKFLHSKYN